MVKKRSQMMNYLSYEQLIQFLLFGDRKILVYNNISGKKSIIMESYTKSIHFTYQRCPCKMKKSYMMRQHFTD